MRTIKTGSIEYDIHEAPLSPLNLRLGMIYAPRSGDVSPATGPALFEAFSCVEVEPGYFVIAGWGSGRTVTVWEGDDLREAFAVFAKSLGML